MFDYFDMFRFNALPDKVEIYFEEANNLFEEYKHDKLESKGFYEEVQLYDYPMRGVATFST
ncbi:hypothetical protein [uncultured Bacteroides sp.]|uniref:hypothetical protein n=1 Tax=uncultured Bacteroides sp. TaxID=162156 RepID=UPI002AAB8CA5|nr:hypothetical protein [uncultured Bacteroides sp.]